MQYSGCPPHDAYPGADITVHGQWWYPSDGTFNLPVENVQAEYICDDGYESSSTLPVDVCQNVSGSYHWQTTTSYEIAGICTGNTLNYLFNRRKKCINIKDFWHFHSLLYHNYLH